MIFNFHEGMLNAIFLRGMIVALLQTFNIKAVNCRVIREGKKGVFGRAELHCIVYVQGILEILLTPK